MRSSNINFLRIKIVSAREIVRGFLECYLCFGEMCPFSNLLHQKSRKWKPAVVVVEVAPFVVEVVPVVVKVVPVVVKVVPVVVEVETVAVEVVPVVVEFVLLLRQVSKLVSKHFFICH